MNDRLVELKESIEKGNNMAPELVMISPTDKCNLSCKTCWRMNKPNEDFDRGLSIERIEEVLSDCREMGVESVDFTGGGEPFLRDDIFEMLNSAKNKGLNVGLTTNSMLLDESKLNKLSDIGIDELLFSLDGMEKTNDMIRGNGTFEKVLNTAYRYKTNYSKRDNIVGFSTVINSENYDELVDIVKIAIDLNLDYVNFLMMNVWESNFEFKLSGDETKSVQKELKKVCEIAESNDIDTNANNFLKHGIYERGPPKFCFAPWDMAFINASGELMACCTLASYYKNLLGNIKQNSFKDLWYNSDSLKEFSEEMKNRNFQDKCKECLPDFVEKYNNYYNKLKENYDFEY